MNHLRSLASKPKCLTLLHSQPLRALTSEAVPQAATPPVDRPGSHRNMRRTFYIGAVVDKIISGSLGSKFLLWTRTRAEYYRLLKTKKGCDLLLKSSFINQLRSSLKDEDLEATKKFGSEKVCLGRSFDEHKKIKMDLYYSKYRSLAKQAEMKRQAEMERELRFFKVEDGVASAWEVKIRCLFFFLQCGDIF